MLMWEVRVRGGPCSDDRDAVYEPSCLQVLPCAVLTGHSVREGEARVILGEQEAGARPGGAAWWSQEVTLGPMPGIALHSGNSPAAQPAALAVRQPLP